MSDHLQQAQTIIGSGLSFDRLDQIHELQRLLGPVIAYKRLLEIVMHSSEPKEQRLAASEILRAASEPAEQVAERLRASVLGDLTFDQLEAIVATGETDPEEAIKLLRKAS